YRLRATAVIILQPRAVTTVALHRRETIMPRPDPIRAVTAAMIATVWGLASLATLLAVDPAVIAWNPRPSCSLTGFLGGLAALLEPACLLTGLILALAGAALARTWRLGPVA